MLELTSSLLSEELNELLEGIKKGNKQAMIQFYENFKVGNPSIEESEKQDDLFFVDLSSLDEKTLVALYQFTSWAAPAYFLRRRYFKKWNQLSDETLMVLVQTLSPKAKDTLFLKYQDNLDEANDELLVLMSQKENHRALEVLFERYLPFVKRIIRRLRNKYYFRGYDLNDLVSEGVIGLYKSKDDFKINRKTRFKDFSRHVIEKHIGTLILRSSNYKNKVLNESFSYHSPIGDDPDVTFEQLLKSEGFKPEGIFINKETFEAIWEKLTSLERQVLKFYDLGLSYEEIGEKVGKKKKAIDNTIQRLRKKGKSYEKSHHSDENNVFNSVYAETIKWMMFLYKLSKDESSEIVVKYREKNKKVFTLGHSDKTMAEIIYKDYCDHPQLYIKKHKEHHLYQ